MDVFSSIGLALLERALIVGGLGGAALVLGHRFSTRGAIMFPIYAAILFASSLVTSQFPDLAFGVRFSGVLLPMVVATVIALVAVTRHTAKQLQMRAQRGLPPVEGRAPRWSVPFVFASVAAVSAGVAVLIR
jgi:hypothetical protein